MTKALRLVHENWENELESKFSEKPSSVLIVCPFIKLDVVRRLLRIHRPQEIRVITRLKGDDFLSGVSDIGALEHLIDRGARIRAVKGLHSKLYVFDGDSAFLTSANLTNSALRRNHEFGCLITGSDVDACRSYFSSLWEGSAPDLDPSQLSLIRQEVDLINFAGGPDNPKTELGDFGVEITGYEPVEHGTDEGWYTEQGQTFIKFFGEGTNRAPTGMTISEEVQRSGCHWACGYPERARPRNVNDGDVLYFARLVHGSSNARIFGRAVALKHDPVADNASAEEIETREWKKSWPRYIRVHHAEFLAGTLANGPSVANFYESLRSDCFEVTQRHEREGSGNTNPRRSVQQKPAMKLSLEGARWMKENYERSKTVHGTLGAEFLSSLDWPDPEIVRGRLAARP